MRRLCLAAVAVVLAVPAAAASAQDRRDIMRCSAQSFAQFPRAYSEPANLVVGPLSWLFARRAEIPGSAYEGIYRWKQPVLVLPGHTVVIRIGAAARGVVGLAYTHAGWRINQTARTVEFQGCARRRAGSRTDGRRVTFWSGGIVSRVQTICVPIEIRVDRGAVRRRVLALGEARC